MMHNGFAIVPSSKMREILKAKYRVMLVEELATIDAAWGTIEERFQRVPDWVEVVKNAVQDSKFDAFSQTGEVKISDIEPVSLLAT